MDNLLKYGHILGLSIWLGSMVMWAMFAPKLYKIDPTRNTTNVLRKTFSNLSWGSYVLSFLTGVGLFFSVKITLQRTSLPSTLWTKNSKINNV